MKVGVIGVGHVGRNVSQRLVAKGVDVVEFDTASGALYPTDELSQCDFATICVDTPRRDNGQVCLFNVVDAIQSLPTDKILLRSTVPPGTTDTLARKTGKAICFSPEYVGESPFAQDGWKQWAHDQLFQIIGGSPEHTRWFAAHLTEIHGAETRIFQCTAIEAEVAKYMENSYFAMKVTFVNQFYDLCEALGADWFTVREAWLLDPRVDRDHTAVFPQSRGFDGRCLPKDLDAIVETAKRVDVRMSVLQAVQEANARYLADWPPK
ncbi:hypothetical protein [Mycobacterium sp. SP-6446]|uniref:hypothetical protein n=1 Tax=Mycobacterium sp. SP-6446 TaxID=1834162 RepID=UPI00096F4944|nr:hypothetical protein [Mycobacterium sp. SP-6446]OMC14945.1 hypothetical protein A5736_20395 [Mycobacterium sp. SP-6446]